MALRRAGQLGKSSYPDAWPPSARAGAVLGIELGQGSGGLVDVLFQIYQVANRYRKA